MYQQLCWLQVVPPCPWTAKNWECCWGLQTSAQFTPGLVGSPLLNAESKYLETASCLCFPGCSSNRDYEMEEYNEFLFFFSSCGGGFMKTKTKQ